MNAHTSPAHPRTEGTHTLHLRPPSQRVLEHARGSSAARRRESLNTSGLQHLSPHVARYISCAEAHAYTKLRRMRCTDWTQRTKSTRETAMISMPIINHIVALAPLPM